MKKEFFIHFASTVVLIIIISLIKQYFSLSYWPLWLGAATGTILPDIDHLIYIYFLAPQELTSQRVNYMVDRHQVWNSFRLLVETRSERKGLIFHNAGFQVLFLILTFLVLSSSGSMFGRGIVLAFALHLSVDQLVDYSSTGALENWFSSFRIVLDSQKLKLYIGGILFLILLSGILL